MLKAPALNHFSGTPHDSHFAGAVLVSRVGQPLTRRTAQCQISPAPPCDGSLRASASSGESCAVLRELGEDEIYYMRRPSTKMSQLLFARQYYLNHRILAHHTTLVPAHATCR